MSDNLEGKGSDFFDRFDNNNWASDFSPTPDQHLGDRTSLLSPDDDPMKYLNLSPGEHSYLLTGPGEYGTNEPPFLTGDTRLMYQNLPPGPGGDNQQPEYVMMQVPPDSNEPPLFPPGDTQLMCQNLPPGPREDIQQPEYGTIEVSSGANEPSLSPGDNQENSSSSKSTGSGSKKRKSVAKRKGKEKIQRRNQGTFCMGESSNSKKPENPEKKDEEVKRRAKNLIDALNRRKTRVNDLQNRLRCIYKQLPKSSPLRAELKKHAEDLKKMEPEIEDVKREISNIRKGDSTEVDAMQELTKIENEKLPKFTEDVDKARKVLKKGPKKPKNKRKELKGLRKEAKNTRNDINELDEDLQNMQNGSVEMLEGTANIRKVHNNVLEVKENTDSLAEYITNKEYIPEDRCKELLSEIAHLYKAITRFPQISTKEPLLLEVPGQYPEEDVSVEVPGQNPEEAGGQQPQSLDEQITDLDERIHVLRAQRDELVRRRANQLAQGQYPQAFDEQITYIDGLIQDLLDERDVFVGMHGILHAQGP